jgi:hypothetical protein
LQRVGVADGELEFDLGALHAKSIRLTLGGEKEGEIFDE